MELYDFANELRDVGQITQEYGFGNIDSNEMNARLTDLKGTDVSDKTKELATNVQKFVPMKEQFVEDKGPGQTKKSYNVDGKVYQVSDSEIKDLHGNKVFLPTSGNDLRAMNHRCQLRSVNSRWIVRWMRKRPYAVG